MSVKARVSRRGARDQTYGTLENTRVLEGLRLNIRDLHAGGENRVQAVETPRCIPVAGKHLSGTRDPRFPCLPVVLGDQHRQTTRGIPRPRALHL